MRPAKAEARKRQQRKAWNERVLTAKQLDALAAVAYGELEILSTSYAGINGHHFYKFRWMLDGVDIVSRLRTLKGYRLVRAGVIDGVHLPGVLVLTEDGKNLLKKEGII